MIALNSSHDLIVLPIAAYRVYVRAYGSAPPTAHLMHRLIGLAYSLAAVGTIFAIDGANCSPRLISREELSGGVFRHGAKELHFLDDRLPITHIGVTRESIEKTANALLSGALGRR
jgi:hypothetical protein